MLHNIEPTEHGPRGEAMADAIGKCVHCGFCLPACPTYQELESEMDSPRGRILLMKSVLEGELDQQQAQPHIDRCLGCLACVTHCPSGVEYGELISSYRSRIEQQQQRRRFSLRDMLIRWTLPYPKRFRWAVRLGKIARPLSGLTPKSLRPMLDLVPDALPTRQALLERSPAQGKRRGTVAVLAGCAQQVLAPDINAAAVRVLNRNGYDVIIPSNQGCCGALSWHTGEGELASRFAAKLIASVPNDVDAMLTTAAGCGSAISEYPLLLAGTELESQAGALAERTMDVSVFLERIELAPVPPIAKPIKVAYHDACHLAHAQRVRIEPRQLLTRIPGLELVEINDPDTCCGSAGTYNIEQPEIAHRLGHRKAENVLATNASLVATGNIGCLVQIQKHLEISQSSIPVLHTVQVLDRAYQQIPM